MIGRARTNLRAEIEDQYEILSFLVSDISSHYQEQVDDVEEKVDHGVGSTDHFSALKIWMFENKFVSLPSHLKTIEPMARPIREKSGTGVYHVILRGINR